MDWTLNVTRADMKAAGFSPSVRLFEAAACGTPIISDCWPGLDSILRTRSEVVPAETTRDVLAALDLPTARRRAVATAARAHVLAEHTADHRASMLEACLDTAATPVVSG
jgi:spore maturation protein CgeB